MLDTHGRKYIAPFIKKTARFFIDRGRTANDVTKLAFLVGILASILVYFDMPILGVVILWLSGFLDSVDGEIARKENNPTAWGTVLDITFDRLVEIGIIIVLGLKYPESRMALIFLSTSIITSMTVFLTVGGLSDRESEKSFYYQAGLMERTEGFIMFSLMILFNKYLLGFTILYGVLVIITALQRLKEARKILKD